MQCAEKNRTQPIIVRLTRHEGEMHRQAIGIHHRVNLARQAPRERPLSWRSLSAMQALYWYARMTEVSIIPIAAS